MTTKPPRRRLVAVDRLTLHRYALGLSAGASLETNPVLGGAIVAEAAWTIAREWPHRWGLPLHWDRIDWRVETEDPAEARDRADRAAEVLA